MLFSLKQDLHLCEKYKISPTQLMFIKVFIYDTNIENTKTLIADVYEKGVRFWKLFGLDLCKRGPKNSKRETEYNKKKIELLNAIAYPLMEKNILIKSTITSDSDPDILEINPIFVKDFELNFYDMPSQLHDTYPHFIGDSSKRYFAKTASPEEFGEAYIRAINNDLNKHNEILELVKWAVENKQIKIGIKKFVESRHWEALKELKEGGVTNVGFDTNFI